MKFNSFHKYIPLLSWGIIVYVLIITCFVNFSIFHSPRLGDEFYYNDETIHFYKYGLYYALCQGTSVMYSVLIFLVSNLFCTNFLVGARILSIIAFIVSCFLLLRCLKFFNLSIAERYFCIVYFSMISGATHYVNWPDMCCTAFLLTALYFIFIHKYYYHVFLSSLFLFIGFACKPVAVFAIPGFIIFILLRNITKLTIKGNIIKTIIFIFGFSVCFFSYHIPGYITYNKLMLEDKGHYYIGEKRINDKMNRRNLEIYYLLVVKSKLSKYTNFQEEVIKYKSEHPNVRLDYSIIEFALKYPVTYVGNTLSHIFIFTPYFVQSGYFFSKWTIINRWIGNYKLLKVITFLLFLLIYYNQRKFIKEYIIYFIIPFCYIIFLCLATMSELDNNWLVEVVVFLSLPITKLLFKYVNIYVLLFFQLSLFIMQNPIF